MPVTEDAGLAAGRGRPELGRFFWGLGFRVFSLGLIARFRGLRVYRVCRAVVCGYRGLRGWEGF